MKRFALVAALLPVAFMFLVGCAQSQTASAAVGSEDDSALRVVATIFPQYDFVRQIAGDRVELSMLISPGAESHGFEPTARDIITINDADLFIYIGGHGDTWVDRILASLDRADLRSVALLDLVEPVIEELVEGMERAHHHDHGHDHDHDHHHDHEPHYDEHVWTCPRNAILIVYALTDVLVELDPANAEFFIENATAFVEELQEIDNAFMDVVGSGVRNTLIFGDRFPFRYFTDTYGLTYFAAFTGCSAETQASPATIAFLIEKVREENIPVVLHVELSNLLIANVIAEATGVRLLEMHSLHNVSHGDFVAGVTYLDIMRRNVEALREALN